MKRLIYIPLILIVAIILSCDSSANTAKKIQKVQDPEKQSHPRNIILMIGDGMGVSLVSAAITIRKNNMNIARCKYIGFSKTSSFDEYITDSGASGTAMATGTKTNNLAIGVDPYGNSIPTILEIVEEKGLATALVATSSITHATPASFIAHTPDRSDYEAIALDFLKTDIDVFIGGGKNHFAQRLDGLNLIDSLKANDYNVVFDIEELSKVKSGKVAGLLYDEHPPRYSEGRGSMLETATLKAIEILEMRKNGFFMMVEGSQIDWAGHENDSEYLIEEMLDFDDAVGAVLDFAEKNKETLVIITADHETGGFAINGGSLEDGVVTGAFTTLHHTATMVPVFAFGPGAEQFIGIYENTEIFSKCLKAFGFKNSGE